LSPIHQYALKYYSADHLEEFLSLLEAKDFEGTVQHLHDKMLPYLKKNDVSHYESELMSIQVELTLTYSFMPQYKEMFDKAFSLSNHYGILKALNKMTASQYRLKCLGDLLYAFEETIKRPSVDIPPHVKRCFFHLFSKLITRREYAKLLKMQLEPYFTYFQDKYHCFDETDEKEAAMLSLSVHKNDFKDDWLQFFNPEGTSKTKPVTLADIKAMMDTMDQRHAELVHYLFMCNYIDYSHYHFRDEWMIDAYVTTYNAYFQEDSRYLHGVNGYVLEILKEWQQDANHKYQKAKKDLYFWMTAPIPEFKPSLGDEIDEAWQRVCNADDEAVIAEALLPFPLRISRIVETGQYEDAASNVYCILEHLALVLKNHEDWFDCMWSGGEQTEIVNLVEVLQEVYCHLRQKKDLPVGLKNEMDIHLEIFNKRTSFFGLGWGDSRYTDMLLDGKKQYGNYADLNRSDFWTEWYLPKLRGEF